MPVADPVTSFPSLSDELPGVPFFEPPGLSPDDDGGGVESEEDGGGVGPCGRLASNVHVPVNLTSEPAIVLLSASYLRNFQVPPVTSIESLAG